MQNEIIYSACPHDCPSTCALEVERVNTSQIGKIRGAKDNSYTDGIICAKVARYSERVHHPNRLSTPLQRVGAKGDNQFREISWDAALDEVSNSFELASQRYGSESVWPYYYAGTMGLVQRDGINRLRNVMGYSGQNTTICTTLADAGWIAGAGSHIGADPREIVDSDLIVVWGGNPASTQVNVMNHISKARKNRNAKLVVVDPYFTKTAQVADLHIALKPGTDAALACSIMHILFRDGYADEDYLIRFTDYPKELKKHLAERDVNWAARITGLKISQIESLAKLYGNTKRSFLRLGYGFTRSRNGAANMHAVSCLPAVTGAWKYRGGGALYSNRSIYRWDMSLIEGTETLDPNIRSLDMSRIGEVLSGNKKDLQGGPEVAAMLIQNTNPSCVAPDSSKVNDGLKKEDLFLCVHEQFMTDTAKLADIVLPATTFLEHDDIYQAGGHSHILLGPKIIEPFSQAKDNHYVICNIAKRLGAKHRGFNMSPLEIIDEMLSKAGWPSVASLKKTGWHDCMPSFETAHHLNGWPTHDKKFHFNAIWQTELSAANSSSNPAMPKLPDHMPVIKKADNQHPFRLITAPAHNFLNTSFTETRTSALKEIRPELLLNADDAKELGLLANSLAIVGNEQGKISLHVAISKKGQQRGVAIIESIWPNSAFPDGIGVNTLTSSEPGYPSGGAVFHDTTIWIKPA